MAFNDKKNTDDVLLRNVMIGLLNLLNRKIQIQQVTDKDKTEIISVPFYTNNAGDETFMKDFFWPVQDSCDTNVVAEGNADPVPRGIISLTSFGINPAALTNKFVRGTHNKEVVENSQHTIKAYSSYLNVVPLALIFDAEIISDSLLDMFKIIQEFIDTFYKAQAFIVDFKGLPMRCQVGFSQDYPIERQIPFTYGDDTKITIRLPLEVEAYQPVFDKDSSNLRFKGNTMENGIGNVQTVVPGLGTFASLEVEVDPSMSKKDADDETNPDYKAPYGYDEDGYPKIDSDEPLGPNGPVDQT